MTLKFIKSSEKRRIVEELEEIYGITELPYLLIEAGKQKIRAFSGSLSKEEIVQFGQLTNVETIGMYMISKKDGEARLNFDATPIFQNQISKRILEITKKQLDFWMRGFDLDLKSERGIVVLKFGENLVGIGRSNGDRIFNYVPKERKLKTAIPGDSNIG